jgi:archaellum component FlaC
MDSTAIVGTVIGVLLTAIGFLIKVVFSQFKTGMVELKESFNQLLLRIDKISDTLDSHNRDLITVLNRNEIQSQFIDSHTEEIEELKNKIQKIEINCATNNHRKHAKE